MPSFRVLFLQVPVENVDKLPFQSVTSVSQSISQSISQSVGQSVGQPVGQPVGQSASLAVLVAAAAGLTRLSSIVNQIWPSWRFLARQIAKSLGIRKSGWWDGCHAVVVGVSHPLGT